MTTDPQALTEQARAVKAAHQDNLMRKANVVGVGVGVRQRDGDYTNEIALIVFVRQKVPRDQLAREDRVPKAIDGVPVDVQQIGTVRVHE